MPPEYFVVVIIFLGASAAPTGPHFQCPVGSSPEMDGECIRSCTYRLTGQVIRYPQKVEGHACGCASVFYEYSSTQRCAFTERCAVCAMKDAPIKVA